jgi:hypothetical protein
MVLVAANVELAAEDGLDAPGGRGFKKMHRTIDVAMVGNGHCLLADGIDMCDKFFDIAGAVKKRVIGMQMQVGEFCHGIALVYSAQPSSSRDEVCTTGAT